MPENIRPRVNEAKEFLEIAKDFKDPKEIVREALGNLWDAGGSKFSIRFSLVKVPGTARQKIMVEIKDDGLGIGIEKRQEASVSKIESFFNLGDSNKTSGSIGSKRHGTKIYYKSMGISVDTWKDGKYIHAEAEIPSRESLLKGHIPTYRYTIPKLDPQAPGTTARVDGFQAKQSEFKSLETLREYIQWPEFR